MSGTTRTAQAHLSLVTGRGGAPRGPEELKLQPSQRLTHFIEAAAEAGLEAEDAVRLGVERALVLADAARLAGDVEAGRRALCHVASAARPHREISPLEAA